MDLPLKQNIADTSAFLALSPSPLELPNYTLPHGYRLLEYYRTGSFRIIRLIVENKLQPHTVYFAHFKIDRGQQTDLFNCISINVWRSVLPQHNAALRDFSELLFNYVLESYNVMIPDQQQDDINKRFWLTRIAETFVHPQRHLFYIDLNQVNHELFPDVTEITSYQEFEEYYFNEGWGFDPAHANKVFVLSNHALKQAAMA